MKEGNCDLRDGDAKTAVFGSNEMLQPASLHHVVGLDGAGCEEQQ